jgi:hypothetical protein
MWEYKTEVFGSGFDTKHSLIQKFDEVLFKYSKDGWELVNFQCADMFASLTIFVFKREKK